VIASPVGGFSYVELAGSLLALRDRLEAAPGGSPVLPLQFAQPPLMDVHSRYHSA